MVEEILKKWQLGHDKVVKHVLEQLPMKELKVVKDSNYKPDINNEWKSPSELLARYVNELRERKHIDGGAQDPIKMFIFRWKEKLGATAAAAKWGQPGFGKPSKAYELLQALCHKD